MVREYFVKSFSAHGDIAEGSLDLVFGEHARPRLAEGHGTAATTTAAALHLPHEEHEQQHNEHHREAGDQQLHPDALLLGSGAFNADVLVQQLAHQFGIGNGRTHGFELVAVHLFAGNGKTVNAHALDFTVSDRADELGVVQVFGRCLLIEIAEHKNQDTGDGQPQQQIFHHVVQGSQSLGITTAWKPQSPIGGPAADRRPRLFCLESAGQQVHFS